MSNALTRRQVLIGSSVAAITGAVAGMGAIAPGSLRAADKTSKSSPSPKSQFKYCLNTSTIQWKLPLVDTIKLAAKLGYGGIEPWLGRDIGKHEKAGGSLKDIKKLSNDLGIEIVSGIGFARWIVDDDEKRAKGLEDAKRDMDKMAQIGSTRIAAPPAGATKQKLDLLKVAQRYRALLDLGDTMGIVPQVEVWGPSATLSRLGEAVFVAVESGHPKACVLPDVYHVYKGGSDIAGLGLVRGQAIHAFHMNDYPADPPSGTNASF